MAGLILFALLIMPDPASGQAPAYDSTSVGRTTGFETPFWVMMRSAVVPGWGQLHNGKWWKAILFAGVEGAFIYGIFDEDRLADDAGETALQFPVGSYERSFWEDRSRNHRSVKKDYVWWGAFTALLSIGDAYVDAHLRGFDVEFREEDSAVLLSFEVYP